MGREMEDRYKFVTYLLKSKHYLFLDLKTRNLVSFIEDDAKYPACNYMVFQDKWLILLKELDIQVGKNINEMRDPNVIPTINLINDFINGKKSLTMGHWILEKKSDLDYIETTDMMKEILEYYNVSKSTVFLTIRFEDLEKIKKDLMRIKIKF
jgi:hypothetical protein